MNELIAKLKGLLLSMKRIEKDGFPDEEKARDYFQEKEEILEAMAEAIGQMESVRWNRGTARSWRALRAASRS